MALKEFADALPDFAKDVRLSLATLLADQVLGDKRKYGLFVAAAHATGYKPLVDAAEAEAADRLDPAYAKAARGAAALMAMNNVYHRFVHLTTNPVYQSLSTKLSATFAAAPGIDKGDFELFCLAVSAQNGCGSCIDGHETVLTRHGVKAETIQAAARCAAVMQAAATVHAAL